MFTSFLTCELLHWIEEARHRASLARSYACIPGFKSAALEDAFACRRAIARMAQLLTQALHRVA